MYFWMCFKYLVPFKSSLTDDIRFQIPGPRRRRLWHRLRRQLRGLRRWGSRWWIWRWRRRRRPRWWLSWAEQSQQPWDCAQKGELNHLRPSAVHSAKTYDVNIKLQREGENKKQIPNWELFSIFCPSVRERGGGVEKWHLCMAMTMKTVSQFCFSIIQKQSFQTIFYFQYYEQDVLDYERYWDGRYWSMVKNLEKWRGGGWWVESDPAQQLVNLAKKTNRWWAQDDLGKIRLWWTFKSFKLW